MYVNQITIFSLRAFHSHEHIDTDVNSFRFVLLINILLLRVARFIILFGLIETAK